MTEWRNSLAERSLDLWTDIGWHLLVAEQDDRLLGVAAGTYLGNVNFGFVGYLCVAPRARGHGLGSRLRSRLRAAFGRDARRIRGIPLEGIVGEVRGDNPWLRHLIDNPRVLALDFPYLQPRLMRGKPPVPLVLYCESLSGDLARLSTRVLRRLLYTAWRRAYRIARPLASPTFRRMLESLEGRRAIAEVRATRMPR